VRECDPITGEVIHASKTTAVRTNASGQASWCMWMSTRSGRSQMEAAGAPTAARWQDSAQRRAKIGYDHVHQIVDDHSRRAYSEILPDEQHVRGRVVARGPAMTSGFCRPLKHYSAAAGRVQQQTAIHTQSGRGRCTSRRNPGRSARRRLSRHRCRQHRSARSARWMGSCPSGPAGRRSPRGRCRRRWSPGFRCDPCAARPTCPRTSVAMAIASQHLRTYCINAHAGATE
jgi:hypothetical protein